ncbi:helix-turn-helix transcriptional regulator [Pseudomonas abietaniphila]|uniref:Transcriptional regulator, AlpA family n=1 Tax=Pseudomonas abietaniphila TaxID=89065 RepID=A0A1G8KD56_9PSED|nr:AlpA family phage regulatory protein [Pseudomonas abietaniphila]SDI41372.1 transcriptional regulator, AlpA family [Pseudomonas abietaniphila]
MSKANIPVSPRARIRFDAACELLGVSRSTLTRKIAADKTFPRPIKEGTTRQAPVYFVQSEIEAWVQAQMDARSVA